MDVVGKERRSRGGGYRGPLFRAGVTRTILPRPIDARCSLHRFVAEDDLVENLRVDRRDWAESRGCWVVSDAVIGVSVVVLAAASEWTAAAAGHRYRAWHK